MAKTNWALIAVLVAGAFALSGRKLGLPDIFKRAEAAPEPAPAPAALPPATPVVQTDPAQVTIIVEARSPLLPEQPVWEPWEAPLPTPQPARPNPAALAPPPAPPPTEFVQWQPAPSLPPAAPIPPEEAAPAPRVVEAVVLSPAAKEDPLVYTEIATGVRQSQLAQQATLRQQFTAQKGFAPPPGGVFTGPTVTGAILWQADLAHPKYEE